MFVLILNLCVVHFAHRVIYMMVLSRDYNFKFCLIRFSTFDKNRLQLPKSNNLSRVFKWSIDIYWNIERCKIANLPATYQQPKLKFEGWTRKSWNSALPNFPHDSTIVRKFALPFWTTVNFWCSYWQLCKILLSYHT